MRRFLTVIVASVALCGPARADGLIQQLPEDTSWVLFKLEGLQDKTKKGGQVERFAGQLKISSVGTVIVDGKKCRWIETEQTYRRPDDPTYEERGRVFKVLIPERQLARGIAPIDDIQRGWTAGLGKFAGGPREIKKTVGIPIPRTEFEVETQFYLGGPAADARPLEPEVVECKLGKFKCAGVAGSLDASTLPNSGNVQVQPPTFEIRLHEKAPFGVVSYTIRAIEPSGNRVEVKATLEDFGRTAVSRLPRLD